MGRNSEGFEAIMALRQEGLEPSPGFAEPSPELVYRR